MRTIPAVLQPIVDSDHWKTFMIFHVGPNIDHYELKYTTLPYDFVSTTLGATYSSDHRLVGVDAPRISDSFDREAFKVILSDSDSVMRPDLDDWKMHGAPFRLYAGFINNTAGNIGGALPGEPIDAFVVAYEGTVDTFSYSVTPDEEISLSIEGSSPVGALDLTRTLLTSKSYLNAKFGDTDTSYDQATAGSREIILLWGKEQ